MSTIITKNNSCVQSHNRESALQQPDSIATTTTVNTSNNTTALLRLDKAPTSTLLEEAMTAIDSTTCSDYCINNKNNNYHFPNEQPSFSPNSLPHLSLSSSRSDNPIATTTPTAYPVSVSPPPLAAQDSHHCCHSPSSQDQQQTMPFSSQAARFVSTSSLQQQQPHQLFQPRPNFSFQHNEQPCFEELFDMGNLFYEKGEYEHAMQVYREALKMKTKTIASGPPTTQLMCAKILLLVGIIQSRQCYINSNNNSRDKQYSYQTIHACYKALEAWQYSLTLCTACLGPSHPSLVTILMHMAQAYAVVLNDYATAEQVLMDALYIMLDVTSSFSTNDDESNMDTDIPNEKQYSTDSLVEVWKYLGHVQQLQGKLDDAESSYEETARLLWKNIHVKSRAAVMYDLKNLLGFMQFPLRDASDYNQCNRFFFNAIVWDRISVLCGFTSISQQPSMLSLDSRERGANSSLQDQRQQCVCYYASAA